MYLKKDDLDVTFCRFCVRKHNCCIRYYNLNFEVRWLARQKFTWFLLCSFVYDLRAYLTTIKTTKTIITRCPLINLLFRIKVVLLCFIEGSSEAKYFLREPDNMKTKNKNKNKLKSDLYQRDCRAQQILSLERGTSIFFGYVTQYTSVRRGAWRKEQRLRSERVAFWLAWMISFEEC